MENLRRLKYEETEDDRTVNSFVAAFNAMHEKYAEVCQNFARLELIVSFYCSMGARFILEGESGERLRGCAVSAYAFGQLAATVKKLKEGEEVQIYILNSRLYELNNADEHTLVEFFMKRIPCSCLDEKYEQVKSITKTGICAAIQCPLPDNGRVKHSSMIYCTGCREVRYCSEECRVAHWNEGHKILCSKIADQKAAFKSK